MVGSPMVLLPWTVAIRESSVDAGNAAVLIADTP